MRLKITLTAFLLAANALGGIATTPASAQAPGLERRVPTQADLLLSYAPVVHRVAPAVVNVYAAKVVQQRNPLFDDPIFRRFFGVPGGGGEQIQRSLGSGVIVDPSGLAVSVSQAFEVRIDPARFDVNRNDDTTAGRLDGKDTAWISKLHAAREIDPSYDPDVDLNGDGWIDGDDLAYVAANFGLCWAGSAWNFSACPAD